LPSYLVIFVGTLVSVLAVGVEMRAISRHQIGLAAGCAAIIAGGQLVAMRLVPGSTDWLDYASYIAANFIGIWVSFSLYGVFQKKSFEFPLHICEGKVKCPFKDGACSKDLNSCPAMKSFFQAGQALDSNIN
jgi:hypothetical protein